MIRVLHSEFTNNENIAQFLIIWNIVHGCDYYTDYSLLLWCWTRSCSRVCSCDVCILWCMLEEFVWNVLRELSQSMYVTCKMLHTFIEHSSCCMIQWISGLKLRQRTSLCTWQFSEECVCLCSLLSQLTLTYEALWCCMKKNSQYLQHL